MASDNQKRTSNTQFQGDASSLTSIARFLLYIAVIAVPFFYLPIIESPFRLPKESIFIALVLIAALIVAWDKKPFYRYIFPGYLPLLILLLYVFARSIVSNRAPRISLTAWFFFLVCILFILLVLHLNHRDGFINKLYLLLMATSLANAVYAVLQYIGFNPLLAPLGESHVDKRAVVGLIGNPNTLSAFIASAGVIFIAWWFWGKSNKASIIGIVGAMIIFTALILSGSKTSLVAFEGAIVFLLSVKLRLYRIKSLLIFIFIIIIMATGTAYLFQAESLPLKFVSLSQQSIAYRTLVYMATIRLIADNPFFGVGPGIFAMAYAKYHQSVVAGGRFPESVEIFQDVLQAHNDYLQAAAELGLLGFIIILWLMITVAGCSINVLKQKDNLEVRMIGISAIAGLIVIAFDGLLSFPLHVMPSIMNLLIFYASIIYICKKNKIKSHRTKPLILGTPGRIFISMFLIFLIVFMLSPLAVEILYFKAMNKVSSGDLDRGRRLFKIANFPVLGGSWKVMMGLGITRLREGDPDDAFYFFSNALRISPKPALLYLNLGRMALVKKDYQTALGYLLEALRYDPYYMEAKDTLLATVEYIAAKPTISPLDAEQLYSATVDYLKDRASFCKIFCRFFLAKGDVDQADELANRALELEATDPEIYLYLGDIAYKKGDHRQAAWWYYIFSEQLTRKPEKMETRLASQLKEIYQAAFEQNERQMVIGCLQNLGYHQSVISLLEDRRKQVNELALWEHYELAYAYYQLKRFDDAITKLAKAGFDDRKTLTIRFLLEAHTGAEVHHGIEYLFKALERPVSIELKHLMGFPSRAKELLKEGILYKGLRFRLEILDDIEYLHIEDIPVEYGFESIEFERMGMISFAYTNDGLNLLRQTKIAHQDKVRFSLASQEHIEGLYFQVDYRDLNSSVVSLIPYSRSEHQVYEQALAMLTKGILVPDRSREKLPQDIENLYIKEILYITRRDFSYLNDLETLSWYSDFLIQLSGYLKKIGESDLQMQLRLIAFLLHPAGKAMLLEQVSSEPTIFGSLAALFMRGMDSEAADFRFELLRIMLLGYLWNEQLPTELSLSPLFNKAVDELEVKHIYPEYVNQLDINLNNNIKSGQMRIIKKWGRVHKRITTRDLNETRLMTIKINDGSYIPGTCDLQLREFVNPKTKVKLKISVQFYRLEFNALNDSSNCRKLDIAKILVSLGEYRLAAHFLDSLQNTCNKDQEITMLRAATIARDKAQHDWLHKELDIGQIPYNKAFLSFVSNLYKENGDLNDYQGRFKSVIQNGLIMRSIPMQENYSVDLSTFNHLFSLYLKNNKDSIMQAPPKSEIIIPLDGIEADIFKILEITIQKISPDSKQLQGIEISWLKRGEDYFKNSVFSQITLDDDTNILRFDMSTLDAWSGQIMALRITFPDDKLLFLIDSLRFNPSFKVTEKNGSELEMALIAYLAGDIDYAARLFDNCEQVNLLPGDLALIASVALVMSNQPQRAAEILQGADTIYNTGILTQCEPGEIMPFFLEHLYFQPTEKLNMTGYFDNLQLKAKKGIIRLDRIDEDNPLNAAIYDRLIIMGKMVHSEHGYPLSLGAPWKVSWQGFDLGRPFQEIEIIANPMSTDNRLIMLDLSRLPGWRGLITGFSIDLQGKEDMLLDVVGILPSLDALGAEGLRRLQLWAKGGDIADIVGIIECYRDQFPSQAAMKALDISVAELSHQGKIGELECLLDGYFCLFPFDYGAMSWLSTLQPGSLIEKLDESIVDAQQERLALSPESIIHSEWRIMCDYSISKQAIRLTSEDGKCKLMLDSMPVDGRGFSKLVIIVQDEGQIPFNINFFDKELNKQGYGLKKLRPMNLVFGGELNELKSAIATAPENKVIKLVLDFSNLECWKGYIHGIEVSFAAKQVKLLYIGIK